MFVKEFPHFSKEQVITTGGKFYADDDVWAQIMYGD
jgi:hypothetical protein